MPKLSVTMDTLQKWTNATMRSVRTYVALLLQWFKGVKNDRLLILDCLVGFQTNQDSESLIKNFHIIGYHTLWKIEESFRIMKSTLEIRPVFHWTPKRIEGHFVVCFLAFLMERKMEFMLKNEKDELPASPQTIQESLNTMQLAGVSADNKQWYIKAKTNPLSHKIFKLLGIDMPTNISSKSELIDRFKLGRARENRQLTFL